MSPHPALPSVFHLRRAKIVSYLLNLDHPRGRAKAVFFRSFGFTSDDPDRFADALMQHCLPEHFARAVIDERDHRVLEFEGPITTPDGRNPLIRTVWIAVPPDAARFITAHPLPRPRRAPPRDQT